MIRRAALAAGLVVAGVSAAVAAHAPGDPLVAGRQASMKTMAEGASPQSFRRPRTKHPTKSPTV